MSWENCNIYHRPFCIDVPYSSRLNCELHSLFQSYTSVFNLLMCTKWQNQYFKQCKMKLFHNGHCISTDLWLRIILFYKLSKVNVKTANVLTCNSTINLLWTFYLNKVYFYFGCSLCEMVIVAVKPLKTTTQVT